MNTKLINKKYTLYKNRIETILENLIPVTDKLEMTEYSRELSDLIESLESPFMFVVIGEVKSGKSSFINSLTGEEICAVDADICTDKVQQFVYSDKTFIEHKEKYYDLKGINSEILKEISIVDTPGTDSIIAEHEEITRRFAPNSNLIFFVFPTLNPHHSSSWEMLTIMKDQWSRNIVFIAAQSDRCSEREIEINRQKIKHYAAERGISEPVIFMTSSKLEQEGDFKNSGFSQVRNFITDTTAGGRHMLMKLNDRMEIARIIFEKITGEIKQRENLLNKDIKLRSNIKMKYESGKDNSINEIEKILGRMSFVFDQTSGECVNKLKKALSTGSILKQAIPIPRFRKNKNKIDHLFLENLIKDMNSNLEKDLSREAAENAAFFIDGIKYRFSEIIREVDKAREIYKDNEGERALDRFSEKRDEILSELLKDLTEMAEDSSLIPALEKHNPDITDTFLKGGAIAAAGAILTLIVQNAFLDVTGGIVSALGILGAGGFIFFKRTKLIKEFKKNVASISNQFHKELRNRFERRLDLIFGDIGRLFENLDKHISIESETIHNSNIVCNAREKELLTIKEEIKKF